MSLFFTMEYTWAEVTRSLHDSSRLKGCGSISGQVEGSTTVKNQHDITFSSSLTSITRLISKDRSAAVTIKNLSFLKIVKAQVEELSSILMLLLTKLELHVHFKNYLVVLYIGWKCIRIYWQITFFVCKLLMMWEAKQLAFITVQQTSRETTSFFLLKCGEKCKII